MDFNQIIEQIAPGLNITAIGAAVVAIVTFAVKVKGLFADLRKNSDVAELFKKALPKDLTVSVAKLAKSEIDRLIAEVRAEFTSAIRESAAIQKDLVRAMLSLRSIPDDLKNEIAKHYSDAKITTVETVKLELSQDIAEAAVEEAPLEPAQPKMYID